MKFEYSPLPTVKNKTVLAPLVPITFHYKHIEFPTFGLVDSGAASSIISTVIADALDIPWRSVPALQGLTMSGNFRFHAVKNIQATLEDDSFMLDLNIVEGISPYQCILGQRDFFHKARISFEEYKGTFEIVFRDYN